MPILVNGFTLRLSSHGNGATLDAHGLTRHFEVISGSFTYMSDAGVGDGSRTLVSAMNVGGALFLEKVCPAQP